MPQMLGAEVAEQIRALQPGVRVLFMSGYTQGLLGAQGVLEPGVNLIEKPFSETSACSPSSTTSSPGLALTGRLTARPPRSAEEGERARVLDAVID